MALTMVAGVGTALVGQVVVLASGILVARMLGVENRGHLALLAVVPLIMTHLGGLGVPVAMTFEIARDSSIVRTLTRALRRPVALQAALLTALHAVLLVVIFSDERHEVREAAIITLPSVPALLALLYGLAILQGQQRFGVFNACRLTAALLYAALALALAIADSGTLPRVAAVYTAALVVAGAVALAMALRGAPAGPADGEIPSFRRLARFGSRSVIGSTTPSDGYGLDQAVVGLLLSSRALGLYVVGVAFTNLARFVSQSIGLIAYPNVAARKDPADARRAMWRFFAGGTAVCGLIVVVLELSVGRLIPAFFGADFADATAVTQILLVGALLVGGRRILADASRGTDRPLLGTVAEVASWLVLLPALAVLTPAFGLEGVAAAMGIAGAASLLVIVLGLVRPEMRLSLWRRPERPLDEVDRRLAPHLAAGGVFLEAYAGDGRRHSRTYQLERSGRWTGVLIEPVAALAAECRRRRPRSQVYQCALVGSEDAPAQLVVADTGGADPLGDPREPPDPLLGTDEAAGIAVPARTLSDVLAEAGAGNVDFLALDVFGREAEVLAGMDLERWPPRLLLVGNLGDGDDGGARRAVESVIGARYAQVGWMSAQDLLYGRVDDGGAAPASAGSGRSTSQSG